MTVLLLRFTLNCFALFVVMKLVPGIQIERFQDLLMATLAIALLNLLVRPAIIFLTIPVTILTFGLFALVINGFIFYMAAHLVEGFRVAGFGSAFLAALLFSIFSSVLNAIFTVSGR